MDEKELKKILNLLEEAGWEPQLCDTPIPFYDLAVHAGDPEDPGTPAPPEMVMIPKAFLSMCPESMCRVQGDSMTDAGIEDGDIVKVAIGRAPHDGDVVVVAIGRECTVKGYYEDDDGVCWLVPQNKQAKGKYKVMRIDEHLSDVYLCGVVTELFKPVPRVSGRNMRSAVTEAKQLLADEPKVSETRVSATIQLLAREIEVARHWYAVCRAMMDKEVFDEKQYEEFCYRVKRDVPHHKHLPKTAEMQSMAVESFAKPVSSWNERRAPVKGVRFRRYRDLAEKTLLLLTMSEAEFSRL